MRSGSDVGSVGRADVLETGPDAVPHPGRRWRAAGIALLLLLLCVGGWHLDSRRRASEFAALLICLDRGEAAWMVAEARVRGMSSYVRPSIGAGTTRAMQLRLYRLVANQAAKGRPDVQRALRRCRDVSILPFHWDLRAAREAYVECLRAESSRLSAIAVHGSHMFSGYERSVLLRRRARELLVSAARDVAGRQTVGQLMDGNRSVTTGH